MGCQLESIKNAIKNKEDFDIFELIEQLEYISKVSSYGAKVGNEYYKRMIECDKIIKKLKTMSLTKEHKHL